MLRSRLPGGIAVAYGREGQEEEKKKEKRLTKDRSSRLKIEDDSHTVSSPCLAWACIRLDRLQRGYRFIRLLDMKGNEIFGGKLLVKVEKVLR